MKKVLILLLVIFIVGCAQEVATQDLEPEKEDQGGLGVPKLNPEVKKAPEEPKTVEEPKVEAKKVDEPKIEDQAPQPPKIEEPKFPTKAQTISTCNSLCKEDKAGYCQELRSFDNKGKIVTGSCRAFAKKGHVDGFTRCQRFCKEFPESETSCVVDGQEDTDCDGIAGAP